MLSLEQYQCGTRRPAPSTIGAGYKDDGRRFVSLLRERLKESGGSKRRLVTEAELRHAFGDKDESGTETPWLEMARRHIAVAETLREYPSASKPDARAIDAAAKASGWPRGLVRDLTLELHTASPDLAMRADGMPAGLWRPAISAPEVMTLLLARDAEADATGVVACLAMERVRDGCGEFHPAPTHGFLHLDQTWNEACKTAQRALGALLPAEEDLRWSLSCHGGLPPSLRGNSAGLALAMLAGKLLGKEAPWTQLEPRGSAASASIREDGSLGTVGFLPQKLIAAVRDQNPRPSFVLVAEDALDAIHADVRFRDFAREDNALHWRGHEFAIIGAKTLAGAAMALNNHRNRRLPGVSASTDPGRAREPLPPDYVHRHEPVEMLHAAIAAKRREGRQSGSLLFIGTAGSGKTTWLGAVLEQEVRAGRRPIYYFVGHGSATPRTQLGQSLYFQLREKFDLPDVAGFAENREDSDPWPARLETLLRAISEKLPRDAAGCVKPEILYLEAADQLRHSEADRLLSGLFKPQLPAGIWLLITCRPDTHFLDSVAAVSRFDFITLEPIADRPGGRQPILSGSMLAAYRESVRQYLVAGNRRLPEPLREPFIRQIFEDDAARPLFKTVRDRLDALDPASGRLSDEPERLRLRTTPSAWLMEAHERATEEALRFTGLVRDRFGPGAERAAWLTLGLMEECESADVPRFFSRRELETILRNATSQKTANASGSASREAEMEHDRRLNLLRTQMIESLATHLAFAANFFKPRGAADSEHESYRLDHPSYNRLIRERLNPAPQPVVGYPNAPDSNRAPRDPLSSDHADMLGILLAGSERLAASRDPLAAWAGNMAFSIGAPFARQCAEDIENGGGLATHAAAARAAMVRVVKSWRAVESRYVMGGAFALMNDLRAIQPLFQPQGSEWNWVGLLANAMGHEPEFLEKHRVDYPQALWQVLWHRATSGSSYEMPVRMPDPPPYPPRPTYNFAPPYVWIRWLWRVLASWGKGVITTLTWQTLHGLRRLRPTPWRGEVLALRDWLEKWKRERTALSGPFAFIETALPTDVQLEPMPALVMRGHQDSVLSVAFAPDGNTAVSGSRDGTLRFWNIETGRELHSIIRTGSAIVSVAYSPDSERVVSCSHAGEVLMSDARTGREIWHHEKHSPYDKDTTRTVAFSPDGLLVLTGSDCDDYFSGDLYGARGEVSAYDARSGEYLHLIDHEMSGARTVAFSPNGDRILAGCRDGSLKIYTGWTDIHSKRVQLCFTGHLDTAERKADYLNGESDRFKPVNSAAFSPDGRSVVSGSESADILLWETKNGRLLRVLKGHSAAVTSVAFSPDGNLIISGSRDMTVRLWDVRTGRELRRFEGHRQAVTCVAFSRDSRSILSGSQDARLRLRHPQSRGELHRFEGRSLHAVNKIYFSSDSRRLLSIDDDDAGWLWNIEAAPSRQRLKHPEISIFTAALSPDGSMVACSGWIRTRSGGRTFRLLNTQSGREMHSFGGLSSYVQSIAFSPDGSQILTGSEDKIVRLWDTAKGRELRSFEGHTSEIARVYFSRDGATIASDDIHGFVKRWNPVTGLEIKGAASSDSDGAPGLWKIEQGQCETIFIEREGKERLFWPDTLNPISVSPDETVFVGSEGHDIVILRPRES